MILGQEQGQDPEFRLTFTRFGEYTYSCVVHNDEKMVGKIVVEQPAAHVASPAEAQVQGKKELDALMARVPRVLDHANKAVPAPVRQSDRTTRYPVLVGYAEDQVDLMAFFPNKLAVHYGIRPKRWKLQDQNQTEGT